MFNNKEIIKWDQLTVVLGHPVYVKVERLWGWLLCITVRVEFILLKWLVSYLGHHQTHTTKLLSSDKICFCFTGLMMFK